MQSFEKLGAFYLGREHDLGSGRTGEELLLYDAKDLTTHALCVGMTGSGKTGLCVTLLEEAAIDGIPAIVIDPKGDIGNLLLTFPQLRPADFRPWIDPAEAQRKGMTPEQYAADRAELWRNGLADWGQDGERIDRFRRAVDLAIYTPGSTAGLPLSVLRSFAAPPPAMVEDGDAMRERVASAASGLLTLLGIDADPIRSREHILLANIIDRAWREGRDLAVESLIRQIQAPPFERIGILDLESFYPAKDRFELAMSLNNLLASPAFGAWMEGEPLDVGRLLYTASGGPRISILSIAHLSDAERMFFVTLLLNEVVAWMRAQPGTGSLRALLYMDEVFGFFPPTANPPSKTPMLTLLKQARAYGLGVVLATQNPVDLDYKGLSNIGTWFLGRLQTERDKMRVMEGLEGAATTTGAGFDRAAMEQTLAGLGSRVFLMNNVHDDAPVIFHTRWAMSYLRGPLTRVQIQSLMKARSATAPAPAKPTRAAAAAGRVAAAAPAAPRAVAAAPPPLPPGITQRFLAISRSMPEGDHLVYRPALLATGRAHYVRVAAKVDDWVDLVSLAPLDLDSAAAPWEDPIDLDAAPEIEKKPDRRGTFDDLPGPATRPAQYKTWSKAFVSHVYRTREASIWHCKALKRYSALDESEGDFRIRLRDSAREKRDLAVEKLRTKYAPKLAALQERIRKAEQRVDREASQYRQEGIKTVISLGSTVLGALFGRKAASVGTVGRASTTMRGAGRTAQQRSDVGRAKEDVASLQRKLRELEETFEEETARTEAIADVEGLEIDEIIVRPRKTDMQVRTFGLVWMPYRVTEDGATSAAFDAGS